MFYGSMLGVSTTDVGTIIAEVWFIAGYGTMGINYIFTGEAKGISDMIDESIGTYELYEGIYKLTRGCVKSRKDKNRAISRRV